LKYLRDLGLYNCDLITLPESIGGLDSLHILTAPFNKLKIIPQTIGDLDMLEGIDFTRNELSSLPETIANLKNLKKLYINQNYFSDAEKEKIRMLLPKTLISF
jgi:Leucine-rich repeat (LRR) protein